jgi:hypothetical protein
MSGQPPMPGQRVRVHVNLHRGDFSVVDPKASRVIAHVQDITLTGVEFRVQPGGLRRIRKQGRREVCAYALGIVAALNSHPDLAGRDRVTFHPFRAGTFTCNGQPIFHAPEVVFSARAGWVTPAAAQASRPPAGPDGQHSFW